MSKVNIICPHMATSLVKTQDTSSNLRYENFWIVDNSSYHSCNVNTNITENKLLFKCDKPRQIYFEQLVFQSHGMDNSLVFTKGKTYYFISTSTGLQDSLDNTKQGHCETYNMKMEIYICKGAQDVHCSDVKPTTQPIAVESMRIKPTTAEPVTAKIETEQPTSTRQPSPTQPNSTQTPNGPDVGYLAKEKEESSLRNGTLWIVIIAVLGALLAASVGINFHFWRKQKQCRQKKPSYDRGCSQSPPLMENV
ncbi:ephrin-B2-like isoform X1 [Oculina patagonica]